MKKLLAIISLSTIAISGCGGGNDDKYVDLLDSREWTDNLAEVHWNGEGINYRNYKLVLETEMYTLKTCNIADNKQANILTKSFYNLWRKEHNDYGDYLDESTIYQTYLLNDHKYISDEESDKLIDILKNPDKYSSDTKIKYQNIYDIAYMEMNWIKIWNPIIICYRKEYDSYWMGS